MLLCYIYIIQIKPIYLINQNTTLIIEKKKKSSQRLNILPSKKTEPQHIAIFSLEKSLLKYSMQIDT